jgi:hypothetical protein
MENTLIINDGFASANISDAEGDLIEVSFLGDGCATIDTKKLEYIALTRENLNSIINLLKKAEEYFDSED